MRGSQRRPVRFAAVALALLAAPAAGQEAGGREAARETAIIETIELPDARRDGPLSLEAALEARRSRRRFGERALRLDEIAQLFWAAQGRTRPGRRTAPSAGALYPLEIYAATRQGLYHYRGEDHSALLRRQPFLRDSLFAASRRQEALRAPPAVFVIAGVPARSAAKYGARAERYTWLEAGHAAQNLLLQAVALGLDAVPVGAFRDDAVAAALRLPPGEKPLYLIPVGCRAEP